MGNMIETTISLQGERSKDFLQTRGVQTVDSDENGNFVLGDELFFRPSEHWLVSSTGNREVVVYSHLLRSRGRKGFRKISVNHEGVGRQRITKGVELVIQTNAPVTVFQQNKR